MGKDKIWEQGGLVPANSIQVDKHFQAQAGLPGNR